jgi:hypothetical protein
MNQSRKQQSAGYGKWLGIGTELPCAVIICLFAGQLMGEIWWGPRGRLYGAVLGTLIGFFFGIYSIYLTIGYYEQIEEEEVKSSHIYMPSIEEIYEDVEIPEPDEELT